MEDVEYSIREETEILGNFFGISKNYDEEYVIP
jgi:hypothetical protein